MTCVEASSGRARTAAISAGARRPSTIATLAAWLVSLRSSARDVGNARDRDTGLGEHAPAVVAERLEAEHHDARIALRSAFQRAFASADGAPARMSGRGAFGSHSVAPYKRSRRAQARCSRSVTARSQSAAPSPAEAQAYDGARRRSRMSDAITPAARIPAMTGRLTSGPILPKASPAAILAPMNTSRAASAVLR